MKYLLGSVLVIGCVGGASVPPQSQDEADPTPGGGGSARSSPEARPSPSSDDGGRGAPALIGRDAGTAEVAPGSPSAIGDAARADADGGASLACAKCSDEIYDESTVASFELTMAAADWLKIVQDPRRAGDAWQRATMKWTKRGISETLEAVAVKAAGHTSRIPGNQKPSVRVSFDELVRGRKWKGVGSIKLDSMVGNTDAMFMRDRLAYWVYRQMGVAAPRSAHARVYVNGDFKGLYEVEEPVRKSFAEQRWGDGSGNLYEISIFMPDGVTWVSRDYDHYLWRGATQPSYFPFPWVPQTNETTPDHLDVVGLVDALNNAPPAEKRARLGAVMNLDKFLTYLAVMTSISDWDAITSTGGQAPNNHFWYHRPDTNKLEPIVWDPNVSFDGFRNDGGAFTVTLGLWHRFEKTKATAWIRSDPAASGTYQQEIWRVLEGPLASAAARIDTIYAQIRDHVYADPKKPVSNAAFDAEVKRIRDVWLPARIKYLKSVLPPR